MNRIYLKIITKSLYLLLFTIILNLSFHSLVKAETIKDFEIEGMSIGDSLLDFFSEKDIREKINSNTTFWYTDGKYVSIALKSKNFKVYEEIGAVFDPNDKRFILHSIEGTFNYRSDINSCYKKQNTITADLKNDFAKITKYSTYTIPYSPDKSGKSISKNNRFKFPDGSAITVICYDMDENFYDPNDQLYLAISSAKLIKWIDEAY